MTAYWPYSPKTLRLNASAVSGTECSRDLPRNETASANTPFSMVTVPVYGTPATWKRTSSATERLCSTVTSACVSRPSTTAKRPCAGANGLSAALKCRNKAATCVGSVSVWRPATNCVSNVWKSVSNFSRHTPDDRITSPVSVQMTSVSRNGSISDTIPSDTGSSARAAAWAMGAEPCPASLENNPRATPRLKAYANVAPRKPPLAAEPVNASRNTATKDGTTCSTLAAMTASAATA